MIVEDLVSLDQSGVTHRRGPGPESELVLLRMDTVVRSVS